MRYFLSVLTTFLVCAAALGGPAQPRQTTRALVPQVPADAAVTVKSFGARGDGQTDDTAAVQAAISWFSQRGGGVIHFPLGIYRIDGQLVFPNDGALQDPRQPPYRLTGEGAHFDGRSGVPTGGTILDLRYADGPKIATYGLGYLEIHGLTLADFGFDSAPFIYTTNTTLHIHDTGFYGSRSGAAAANDAIVLGGATAKTTTGGIDVDAPFQGYGTVIRDNYFARVRRLVHGRVYANGVAVYGNTSWHNCGTNLPDGAAIEIDGDPEGATTQVAVGWYVAGNLIEMPHYPYGIKVRESQRSAFLGNNFFDPGAVTRAYYRFEESGRLNYVLAGFHDDEIPFVEDETSGIHRNTIVNFHAGQESLYPQAARFGSRVTLAPGQAHPYGPRVVSPSGAELSYQFVGDRGVSFRYLNPEHEEGESVELMRVMDAGDGQLVQELKADGAWVRNQLGSMSVQSAPGSHVEIADTTGSGIRVRGQEIESTTTGAKILFGQGPPTAAAANGSIYLRSDGSTGTTFYVREDGAWVAK